MYGRGGARRRTGRADMVFEVPAKNRMMKPVERKRYRLVLEQAVAVSPEAVKQEEERVLDDGTEADDGILEGDDNVEYVVEEKQTEGDAPGQDSGTEAEDGIQEGDGGYVDGDGGGEHEDERSRSRARGKLEVLL